MQWLSRTIGAEGNGMFTYAQSFANYFVLFALRPFIRESCLVGSELFRKSCEDSARSDLKRRVIASFRSCGDKEKWRNEIGFKADSLMVGGDKYSELRSMIYGDDAKPVPSGVEMENVVKNLTEALLEFAKLMKEIR